MSFVVSGIPTNNIKVPPQNVRFQNVRFQNVWFQNVRFQNVRFTKRQVYKTSFDTLSHKFSLFLSLPVCHQSSLLAGGGLGTVGEEPNQNIQYSVTIRGHRKKITSTMYCV